MTEDMKRHTLDTYTTPVGLARLMVEKSLGLLEGTLKSFTPANPLIIYDLGAGPGVFGAVAHDMLTKLGIPHRIIGFEINPVYPKQEGYDGWFAVNVLTMNTALYPKAHLILMNPPFVLGEKFVRKAIELVHDRGFVVALLPDHFEFYSVRDDFFAKHHYYVRWVLNRRPSFYYQLLQGNERYKYQTKTDKAKGTWTIPHGKNTDARHYCLFVFDNEEREATHRLDWEYDSEDPVHQRLQASPSIAVYSLIYEASRAEEGDTCWDDLVSMVAALKLGEKFLNANDAERAGLRAAVEKKLAELQEKEE
jgi:hypothetical protein